MNKDEFLTMSPAKRVQEINKLLESYSLKEISNFIGIPSSSFSKIMREGDYFYHKADKKYYPFVRSEEERLIQSKSNENQYNDFIEQHENTLKMIIEHFENTGLLILDKRIYSNDSVYSNKSIRMNNDIYEEFINFCRKHYPHLKVQHIIAQALIDAMKKYKPIKE